MNKELYIFLKLFKDGQIHSVGDIASSHHIDSEECIKKLEYLQTLDYISSEGTWAIMKESSYLQSTYAITIQGKAALDLSLIHI